MLTPAGLFYVDDAHNLTRLEKASASWYRALIAEHKVTSVAWRRREAWVLASIVLCALLAVAIVVVGLVFVGLVVRRRLRERHEAYASVAFERWGSGSKKKEGSQEEYRDEEPEALPTRKERKPSESSPRQARASSLI